ncbi:uncharacterized protein L199_008002 [Kwoniella botswanensis]|uniref:uncharacterized protein n=1 Tax=Kwoniella botswanensis TaxID=1268659 RepID=UPI00315D4811
MADTFRNLTKSIKDIGSKESDMSMSERHDWGATSYGDPYKYTPKQGQQDWKTPYTAGGTNTNTNYGTSYAAPQGGYGYPSAPTNGSVPPQDGYAYPPQGGYPPTYGGYSSTPAPSDPNASTYGTVGGFVAGSATTEPPAYDASHATESHGVAGTTGAIQHYTTDTTNTRA